MMTVPVMAVSKQVHGNKYNKHEQKEPVLRKPVHQYQMVSLEEEDEE